MFVLQCTVNSICCKHFTKNKYWMTVPLVCLWKTDAVSKRLCLEIYPAAKPLNNHRKPVEKAKFFRTLQNQQPQVENTWPICQKRTIQQPTSQVAKQSISLPFNQLTSQSANQITSQPAHQPIRQPPNQTTSQQPAIQPISQHDNQAANHAASQQIYSQQASLLTRQPNSQPISQTNAQPANQPANSQL